MRKLVDEDQLRLARDCGIQIELLQSALPVRKRLQWYLFQAFQQCGGFAAAVRFNNADNDVHALVAQLAGRRQHCECLAHACGSAKEDFQFTALRADFLLLQEM
jgi:hypothetical protein